MLCAVAYCGILPICGGGLFLSHPIKFLFVYPNRDEVECIASLGESLYEAAIRYGIQMDTKVRQSCLVYIQTKPGEGEFSIDLVKPATEPDFRDISAEQLGRGARYADLYQVHPELEDARIMLNLVRIVYKDRQNNETVLHAFCDESMLALRERKSNIIDLGFSCHGALACSTCHCVIDVSDDIFKSLGEISEDEEDLMYYCNPEAHSRLGCQVKLTKEMDKMRIRHPKAINV